MSEFTQERRLEEAEDAKSGKVLLRGRYWSFTNIQWARAEPDVGIMSDYVEGFDLEDDQGVRWDWDKDQLTAQEEDLVNSALASLPSSEESYEDPRDDTDSGCDFCG
jgi:hypothetical protein